MLRNTNTQPRNCVSSPLMVLPVMATVAVVGGGATGVSVADNLARRGGATVHLFDSGEQPLPGYHPRARSWIVRRLTEEGADLPGNRRIPGLRELLDRVREYAAKEHAPVVAITLGAKPAAAGPIALTAALGGLAFAFLGGTGAALALEHL